MEPSSQKAVPQATLGPKILGQVMPSQETPATGTVRVTHPTRPVARDPINDRLLGTLEIG